MFKQTEKSLLKESVVCEVGKERKVNWKFCSANVNVTQSNLCMCLKVNAKLINHKVREEAKSASEIIAVCHHFR